MAPVTARKRRPATSAAVGTDSPRLARGAILGLKSSRTADLIRQIEQGLPFASLVSLSSTTGIPPSALADAIGIPERTFARRKTSGVFSSSESERLLRISGLFEKAVSLFEGNAQAAAAWLTTPKAALNGESPMAYSRTELGAREVENLIGRLEHGVFS